ncbi:MAG: Fic family protein [Thermodesulfobacteriota bacterium]
MLPEIVRRVETVRFGPFVFQVGADHDALALPLQRVIDAQERFRVSPLSEVASRLEPEVLVSSVFGTNRIEAGKLTEEETATALELSPEQVESIEQRRVTNIRKAYVLANRSLAPGWRLTVDFIRTVHAAVTEDLPHVDNRPGVFRNNQRGYETYVGDAAHGGRYKPPQSGSDIELLLSVLVSWHEELAAGGIPALIRAPLLHLYYEQIHPFYDGNGRVGRILEASVLHAAGFRYAPFAMASYYLDRIDAYFTLFNTCRKSADNRRPNPNTPFLLFHLEGMLGTINHLHDRVNDLVRDLLLRNLLSRFREGKDINARQHAIVSHVLERGPLSLDELRRSPWYVALYEKKSDKTRLRDLRKLYDLELLHLDRQKMLRLGSGEG